MRDTRRAAPLGPSRAPRLAARDRHGDGDAERDARLSAGVGARSMDRDVGAAVGDALVRPAGGRDQADLGLFMPRHERQSARAHLRARLRQCARHRRRSRSPTAAASRSSDGWRGAPEEQGFLRDVQGSACDRFTTVLAPGSNVFHYDHIHVDLMRRGNGHRACNPRAVSGEEVAARARAQLRPAGPRSGRHRLGRSAPQGHAAEAPAADAPSPRTRSATNCRSPSRARTARTRRTTSGSPVGLRYAAS